VVAVSTSADLVEPDRDHRYVLFPGRHHLLTRFQADYLSELVSASDATIVWAVTSANHENTKRNPVPFHRREAAIERFGVQTGLRCIVVPVFDTAPTDRFAEVTLKNIEVSAGIRLVPENTVVACSTPPVAALYEKLGFAIAEVEADPAHARADGAPPERPWEVLMRLADGDETWRALAHPATTDVFDRYQLVESVRAVVNDPVVGAEGGLTATRNYRTYVAAFADGAARK
jgi:nicotinamide mononucleotide adenylyltransferase